MIVLLDSNAFRRDVFAKGQAISALFDACESGALEGAQIWIPQGVVEELVRQFAERLKRLERDLKKLDYELSSFRLKPELPAFDEVGVAAYRADLTARLTGSKRRIAPHPRQASRVVDWAAQRRHPVSSAGDPEVDSKSLPVHGVVDAAIWLTVIEAAAHGDVAVVTQNSSDFADPDDAAKPHPQLRDDLDAAGINPTRVAIYNRVIDFNSRFVLPVRAAQEAAEAFLADQTKADALRTEIEEAMTWFPLSDATWVRGVEIDEATLAEFTIDEDPVLVRADPAEGGFFMRLEVAGEARLDLGVRKGYAADLEAAGISVTDWDLTESMLLAETYVPTQAVVEVRVREEGLPDGQVDIAVTVDFVLPS